MTTLQTRADKPLSDRIADVLEGEPPSADVAALIQEVEKELQRLARERDKAHELSLDPLARSETVQQARQAASARSFDIERLTVALDRLKDKHEAACAREKEADYRARRAEILAERDALAEELRDRYPALTGELANLLRRIKENNERLPAINWGKTGPDWIEPVECVVRGMAENSIWTLVKGVRLPPLDPNEHAMSRLIWPPPVQRGPVVSAELAEAMAAAGARARQIAEVNETRRKAQEERKRRFQAPHGASAKKVAQTDGG
jgi:hypothetical protein